MLVDKRRDRQILTCIWRNINKVFIKTKVPQRHTRAAEGPTIYLPVPRTELFKNSVFYYGAFLWNNLPLNVRMQDNVALKTCCKNTCYNCYTFSHFFMIDVESLY